MISLNLLSPADRKEINEIRTYFIIKNASFILVSIVLIISTVFFFSTLILQNNNESIGGQIDDEIETRKAGTVSSLGDTITELNQQLTKAGGVQSSYVPWTSVIRSMVGTISTDITINRFHFNLSAQSFEIDGVARDRNALLTMKEKMQTLPYLANITSPVTNLTLRENIDFKISAQVTNAIYEESEL